MKSAIRRRLIGERGDVREDPMEVVGVTSAKVLVELSVSLDGYVAGPNVEVDQPMGEGGERLHDWMFSGKTQEESDAFEVESFADTGAVVMGRRVFDLGVGP